MSEHGVCQYTKDGCQPFTAKRLIYETRNGDLVETSEELQGNWAEAHG